MTAFVFDGEVLTLPSGANHADATAVAVTPLELCRIRCDALREACRDHPALAERLALLASDRLVAAREHMLLLGRKTAMQRVASFLADLARRQCGGRPCAVDLPMQRTDIGDYLGLQIETVSRTFSELKASGVLALPTPAQAVIEDVDALVAVAGAAEPPAREGSPARWPDAAVLTVRGRP